MNKKNKLISVVICFALLFSISFSCFGLIANIEDTLVLERVHYSGTTINNYDHIVRIHEEYIAQGEDVYTADSFMDAPQYPNYFFQQFNVYSSSGLPIAEGGHTYSFFISNFLNSIDSIEHGVVHLSSISKVRLIYQYSDGSWTDYFEVTDYDFGLTEKNSNYLKFNVNPRLDLERFHVQIYYDIEDFGIPFFNAYNTTAEELSETVYIFGTESFNIDREEVYPVADGSTINNYANEEKELIDATSGGLQEITSLSNNLTQAFLPSSSIYRGAMFFGNFMSDIVGTIPDLNMIILVSLAIGIIMVVLGSVLFTAGSGRGNKVKGNKGSKGG